MSEPHSSQNYGLDEIRAILVQNSELAWFDRQAIVDAIDRQTNAITELLEYLKLNPTNDQLNTNPAPVYHTDTKVIQLDATKPIDAAIRWLQENDPELKLTARQAAIRANMSQATINRAQQRLRTK